MLLWPAKGDSHRVHTPREAEAGGRPSSASATPMDTHAGILHLLTSSRNAVDSLGKHLTDLLATEERLHETVVACERKYLKAADAFKEDKRLAIQQIKNLENSEGKEHTLRKAERINFEVSMPGGTKKRRVGDAA